MPTIESLVARGYFPRELPPCFTTASYGSFLAANLSSIPPSFNDSALASKHSCHNLARPGTLRRKLGIPNPINFFQIVQFVVRNWSDLVGYASRSHLSITTPSDSAAGRAISHLGILAEIPKYQAKLRSNSRCILQADVSRFYHSIYTHSIPWAIHGKAETKTNRSNALIGNALDGLLRRSQDRQTLGIPIGPDTSLLIAEILLGAVDVVLARKGIKNGFRYIDDYELGFVTRPAAEEALGIIQEVLNEYELALNPNKTKIIELPEPMESLSISELRTFSFRNSAVGQQSDLLRYFDRAFTLVKEHSEEPILRFAIARLSSVDVQPSNLNLYENLLLQSVLVEPGTISFVLSQLVKYRNNGYTLSTGAIAYNFNEIIRQHAPLGHGSEVAWAVWGSIILGTPITAENAGAAAKMNDSVVGLLLLQAKSKGQVDVNADFGALYSFMTGEDLYGEHWLISYEANVRGWASSVTIADHVDSDPCFSILKKAGVSFFDITCVKPSHSTTPEGLIMSTSERSG